MTIEGFDLAGKRALVVGARPGLCQAVAAALTEAGASVLLSLLDHRAGAPSGNFVATGAGEPVRVDLASPESADGLVAEAVRRLNGLDVLVWCGGPAQAGPFVELGEDAWQGLVVGNLTAPIRLVRAAARVILDRGGGRIICLVSTLGERGVPNAAAYGACQAGLIQLTRALALEWARSNLTVNTIGLGWLEGDPLVPNDDQQRELLLKYLPMRRLGREDEVGALVVYLASDAAELMTGQTIFVDGALMAHA